MRERGKEYVPGAFTSASAGLPGTLRFATSGASACLACALAPT